MDNVTLLPSPFLKLVVYITHNAILPLSDITGGSLSDYKQISFSFFLKIFSPVYVACTLTTRLSARQAAPYRATKGLIFLFP